jgi:manganese transport protein
LQTAEVEYAPPAPPAPPEDPYTLPPEAAEDPPRSLGRAMRQIGPGLILAGAIVGTGELIATTNTGAKVGFALLWLVILSCFVKVFVQAELGRYTISSGRTTLAGFRDIGGVGTLFGWWWVGMMFLTQLQLGAMLGGIGHALHVALPGAAPALASALPAGGGAYVARHPEIPWAAVVTVVTAFILALGSYRVVERLTTVLVMVFTLATVGCVLLLPATGHSIDWGEVAAGLRFQVPQVEGAVVAAIAMFGITGVGATELVAYPYWCIEKGYARKAGPRNDSAAWLARAQGWLRVMRLDVWVSLAVYTIATLAFYFLGAATLHGRVAGGGGLPSGVKEMTDALTQMYVPVLGQRGATWFIVAGVFAVLYSTVIAASGANARTLADFLHVNDLLPFRRPGARVRTVAVLCVVFLLVDFVLFVAIKSPLKMVLIGGFVQAVTLPMIAVAAIYLRYKRTDPRLRPGPVWDAFLWLSMLALLATATYGVWDFARKFLAN